MLLFPLCRQQQPPGNSHVQRPFDDRVSPGMEGWAWPDRAFALHRAAFVRNSKLSLAVLNGQLIRTRLFDQFHDRAHPGMCRVFP